MGDGYAVYSAVLLRNSMSHSARSDDMNGTLDDSLTVASTSPPSLLAWQPAKALVRIGLRWPTELAISFADLCAWPTLPIQSGVVTELWLP